MKKILSLTLVVLMLLCIVPMNIFAGDTILPDLPGYHTRYAEFHIVQNGGYYNADSGEAITNGGFYTAANGLNIPNGYTGNIVIYVYQATNEPAYQVMNHYVGVVYTDQGTVSNTFYPLGDLMTVIYRSMVKDGYTLTDLTWVNFGASWYDPAFLTVAIPEAVFADVGALHGFNANWAEAVCVDHVFGADKVCVVCGEVMQETYIVGDYTYRAIGSTEVPVNMHGLGVMGGWAVYATDKTKTSYGEIRETLHGYPVTLMYKTFEKCTNMTVAPAIPAQVQVAYNAYKGSSIVATPDMGNVQKLYGTFKNCKNLTNIGTIPATVTDMTSAFAGCTALTNAPAIPASVTNMTCVFMDCKALTNAPAIPASVTNMTRAFKGCTKLTAAPDVTDVANITEAFDGCTAMTGTVSFCANLNARAFRNTKITSATINASKIEISCFSGTALKTVNYDGSLTSWTGVTVEEGNGKVKTANVNTTDTAASVVVKNGKTYVTGLENAKDFFIAEGTHNTYREVKNVSKVDDQFYLGVGGPKFAGAGVYTYAKALAAGNYTLCVRNVDGTSTIVAFTVA